MPTSDMPGALSAEDEIRDGKEATVRIEQDKASWDAGYKAGLAGGVPHCPMEFDGLSFWSGVIEGKAAKQEALEEASGLRVVEKEPKPNRAFKRLTKRGFQDVNQSGFGF